MIKTIINLQAQSFLLCSSGEDRANIDSEIVFDEFGFPYFPGRRLKGLLRENMIEVLEIMGKSEEEIKTFIERFFGIEGSAINEGKLIVNNLFIPGHAMAVEHLRKKENRNTFLVEGIQRYFTQTIQQTKIGEDGIAEDRSLRTYNVLDKLRALEGFQGELLFKKHIDPDEKEGTKIQAETILSEEEKKVLHNTIAHFRYAGLRRNRGFGKINCTIGKFVKVEKTTQPIGSTKLNEIAVTITCEQNIILSTKKGEQNTVYSEDYISGNRLRGVLASLFIRKFGADPIFKKLFLYGSLTFPTCYPKGTHILPACIRRIKYNTNLIAHNILDENENKNKDEKHIITKRINGFVSAKGIYNTPKAYNFHNSRPDRSAGRSVEDQTSGGIFYYESIQAGTVFHGTISGDATALNQLIQKIGYNRITHIGKSKSAQYGRVNICLEPVEFSQKTKVAGDHLYLLAESPVVLFNENGFPSPDLNTLKKQIGEVEIINSATAITHIEQYNTQWLSKSGKIPAYKEGSCFKVEATNGLSGLNSIGEWQEQGFGKIKILTEADIGKYKALLTKEKQNNTEKGNTENASSEKRIDPDTLPDLLKNIFNQKEEEDRIIKVKKMALEASGNYKSGISNSLIGRMNGILAFDKYVIKKELINLKDKQAGQALEKLLLYDDLMAFEKLENKYNNFEEYQIYWTTFFDSFRLRNKIKSNN